MLYERTFTTPVGTLIAIASETHLHALEFLHPDRQKLLKKKFPERREERSVKPLHQIEGWLRLYFEKDFSDLPLLPLAPVGAQFEQRVWKIMREIPPGETLSYGQLAGRLGQPTAARAVGNASRKNSLSLVIPCHRVVGKSGNLTGYGGGLPQKAWLLAHECIAACS